MFLTENSAMAASTLVSPPGNHPSPTDSNSAAATTAAPRTAFFMQTSAFRLERVTISSATELTDSVPETIKSLTYCNNYVFFERA
jgi:hypothetical protein